MIMIGRKTIMTQWVGDEPPSIQLWRALISDIVSLEKLKFCISGQCGVFMERFGRVQHPANLEYQYFQYLKTWSRIV